MGFWARLGNIFKGFGSLFLKDIEEKNPEIAYENSINSMTVKYGALKKAAGAIIRRRDEIQLNLDEERKKMIQVTAELTAAVEQSDREAGEYLIQQQTLLTNSIADLESDFEIAVKEADNVKSDLMSVKGEINKLKHEKDRNLARLKSAEAKEKINAQIEGLSPEAEIQALDNVRTHIKNKVAEANLSAELKESDLDNRLSKLRKSSASVTARSQFEKLLAEKQQKTVPAEATQEKKN